MGAALRQPQGLADGLRRPDTWRRLQLAGMRAEVGWQTSAAACAALCRRLTTAA